jgi:hypothetical protein
MGPEVFLRTCKCQAFEGTLLPCLLMSSSLQSCVVPVVIPIHKERTEAQRQRSLSQVAVHGKEIWDNPRT